MRDPGSVFQDGVGPVFAGGVFRPAGGAVDSHGANEVALLEDRLRLLVEAPRAEVVHRLWSLWVVGPYRLWREIEAIDDHAGTELEKAVSGAILPLFLHFSNTLSQARMLLLELHEGTVPHNDLILKVDQFLSYLGNSGTCSVEVADLQGCPCNRQRAADGTEGARDE